MSGCVFLHFVGTMKIIGVTLLATTIGKLIHYMFDFDMQFNKMETRITVIIVSSEIGGH